MHRCYRCCMICVCVCVCVCLWSQLWAVLKWLNRSRYHLEYGLELGLGLGSNSKSDILALCGRTRRPLWENTRSTGAELAGTHSILSNIGWRHLNSLLWDSVERQASSRLKEREFIVSMYCRRRRSCCSCWSVSKEYMLIQYWWNTVF